MISIQKIIISKIYYHGLYDIIILNILLKITIINFYAKKNNVILNISVSGE